MDSSEVLMLTACTGARAGAVNVVKPTALDGGERTLLLVVLLVAPA